MLTIIAVILIFGLHLSLWWLVPVILWELIVLCGD